MNYKKLRQLKKLSQVTVAMSAGISLMAYQLIERGVTQNPRPETLKRLKEIFTDETESN